MLTAMIMHLVLAGVTQAPASLDMQTPKNTELGNTFSKQSCLLAYNGPVHGPDPDREIHDNSLPSSGLNPYGRSSGGSDPYGGRYGGTDPYSGKTGNGLGPYGR